MIEVENSSGIWQEANVDERPKTAVSEALRVIHTPYILPELLDILEDDTFSRLKAFAQPEPEDFKPEQSIAGIGGIELTRQEQADYARSVKESLESEQKREAQKGRVGEKFEAPPQVMLSCKYNWIRELPLHNP